MKSIDLSDKEEIYLSRLKRGAIRKPSPTRSLIIDSDKNHHELYKKLLSVKNYKADIFNDAHKALDAFKKEFYPIVIIDSDLSGISATDICIRIRAIEEGRKSVIIVLTEPDKVQGFGEFLNAGADDFLQKPVNYKILEARMAIAERRVREILENRLASEKLRRLSLIARRTDNLVVLTDERGYIEWVNEGFERVTEYSLNEVIGKRPGDFLQGKDTNPATVKYMEEKLNQNLGFDVEIVNYSKSSRKYWLAIEVRPIFDETGRLTNFMAIESDITALKTAQEEIARAREQEMEIGSKIQKALLFGNPPNDIDRADLAVLTMPSLKIDGDFFDIHNHNNTCFDVLIGDVMGKGVPAALVGAATKSELLRAESHLVTSSNKFMLPEPEEIVMAAHAELTKELEWLESFVTICLSRFDLEKNEMRLVNCGHTGTIHYSSEKDECLSFKGLNLPLGVDKNEVYKQISVPVGTGDFFVFYSDGVTDARNSSGELYGENRLKDFICKNKYMNSNELIDKLKHDIMSFSAPGNLFDDITCVAVKIK